MKKRLLTVRDKITLFWFGSAVYTLYRYLWERPMSVATFTTIVGVAIYAVILIGLNNKKESPAALAGCRAHK